MDVPENIEDLTIEQMKELRRKLNELITDREMTEAIAKANHDEDGNKTQERQA